METVKWDVGRGYLKAEREREGVSQLQDAES